MGARAVAAPRWSAAVVAAAVLLSGCSASGDTVDGTGQAGAVPPSGPSPSDAASSAAPAGPDTTASGAEPPSAPASATPVECSFDDRERRMRGAWLTTVRNIDWPSEPGLSADEQREELDAYLDDAAALGLNAVFLHVRPTADAVYESDLEPWARYLTGEQGGDPGYDPLEHAVAEAHERGLELHAWFNPYRVGFIDPDLENLAEGHPAEENPEWVVEHGDEAYLDPGDPEVRAWVTGVVLDVVERYDIDGVHFDDYFYPYPKEGEVFDDDATWEEYGGDFDDRADWRRDNVDRLVADVHEGIDDLKPWVSFGISPFGIWRNSDSDPTGSDTSGLESYSAQYADTRTWIQEGTIDYVAPQLYWSRGFATADYETLAQWWADEVEGTGVDLYVGQAAYRVGDQDWRDEDALSAQLDFSGRLPQVGGDVYFSIRSLRENAAEAYANLAETHYAHPALPPGTAAEGQGPLTGRVGGVTARADGDRVDVEWEPVEDARFYAVYRVGSEGSPEAGDPEECLSLSPDDLVGVTGGTGLTDPAPLEDGAGYAVTALDVFRTEGPVSEAADVRG
ncbi:glycoside hydrolase family 10 protein [Nocardiopsis lucentensis]|uniref:glycoside hydrolase family 10 protein n=1 Tax=Nocardiopsis lucentensis TaxID=53441 RepID=UPI000346C1A5|nr:family 10 glycosylhydrolase [Nocardiopsis lucentensis]